MVRLRSVSLRRQGSVSGIRISKNKFESLRLDGIQRGVLGAFAPFEKLGFGF